MPLDRQGFRVAVGSVSIAPPIARRGQQREGINKWRCPLDWGKSTDDRRLIDGGQALGPEIEKSARVDSASIFRPSDACARIRRASPRCRRLPFNLWPERFHIWPGARRPVRDNAPASVGGTARTVRVSFMRAIHARRCTTAGAATKDGASIFSKCQTLANNAGAVSLGAHTSPRATSARPFFRLLRAGGLIKCSGEMR